MIYCVVAYLANRTGYNSYLADRSKVKVRGSHFTAGSIFEPEVVTSELEVQLCSQRDLLPRVRQRSWLPWIPIVRVGDGPSRAPNDLAEAFYLIIGKKFQIIQCVQSLVVGDKSSRLSRKTQARQSRAKCNNVSHSVLCYRSLRIAGSKKARQRHEDKVTSERDILYRRSEERRVEDITP